MEKLLTMFASFLKKNHLSLFTASLRRLFSSFIPDIWPFWGLAIMERQIDVFYSSNFLLMIN